MKPPPHIIAALVAATHEPTSTLFFTPVRLRARIDGWSPDKQRLYVAGIAATGRADRAAALCHASPQSAARLRHRPDAASFVAACCAAFGLSKQARWDARARQQEAARLAAARDVVRGFAASLRGEGSKGAEGAKGSF